MTYRDFTPENRAIPENLDLSINPDEFLTLGGFHGEWYLDPALISVEILYTFEPVPVDVALLFIRAGSPLPIEYLRA